MSRSLHDRVERLEAKVEALEATLSALLDLDQARRRIELQAAIEAGRLELERIERRGV